MLTGTVFGLMKEYMEEYLYGFDKEKLDIDLMGGQIYLKKVNVRADKVNKLLAENNAPIMLKAGMMREFNVQFSKSKIISEFTFKKLASLWGRKAQNTETAVQAKVEELFLVLGPADHHMKDGTEPDSDESDTSFDSAEMDEGNRVQNETNMTYNKKKHHDDMSFEAQQDEIRFKQDAYNVERDLEGERMKKKEEIKKLEIEANQVKDSSGIASVIPLILNFVSLDIARIHIRFEDDTFCENHPFSFGLLLDGLNVGQGKKEIEFESPLDMAYIEKDPVEDSKLLLKEIAIKGLRVYWNSESVAYIPSSL